MDLVMSKVAIHRHNNASLARNITYSLFLILFYIMNDKKSNISFIDIFQHLHFQIL